MVCSWRLYSLPGRGSRPLFNKSFPVLFLGNFTICWLHETFLPIQIVDCNPYWGYFKLQSETHLNIQILAANPLPWLWVTKSASLPRPTTTLNVSLLLTLQGKFSVTSGLHPKNSILTQLFVAMIPTEFLCLHKPESDECLATIQRTGIVQTR